MSHALNWKPLSSKEEFANMLEGSVMKPTMVFKHSPSSPESARIKESLEQDWTISPDHLDIFIVDVVKDQEVAYELTENAGVRNEIPQILLFADGVAMYDEDHEMISVKKIKIALKIINRTFQWLDTRVS